MKKIHRFIIEGVELSEQMDIRDRDTVHQMNTVLRLRAGEAITICNGQGYEATGVITQLDKTKVVIAHASVSMVVAEPSARVTLYIALVKRDMFELIIQKAVEVGVTTVVPLITNRTIKTAVNMQRIKTIIREATEQSGRGVLMTITEPTDLRTACVRATGERFVCNMDGDLYTTRAPESRERSIFIGPEGGWDDEELRIAVESGCKKISLGSSTLRAETAAIVATHWACTQ